MNDSYAYDVFISYSSTDKEWVRGELLTRLEEAGLKVMIDFRDFTRGASSVKEMERAVQVARKTLLILTPAYIESGWCELENNMSLELDPTNRNLRRIPVLKEPCAKPPHMRGLTHIDFTDNADHNLARLQLLTALGKPPELPQPQQPSRDEWFLKHPWAYPGFVDRLVVGSGGTSRLTLFELHG